MRPRPHRSRTVRPPLRPVVNIRQIPHVNSPLPPSRTTPRSRRVIVALFALLFLVHHDFWAWGDRRLVLGFLPVGLFYHALFSVAAGMLWAFANYFAWPDALERWANEPAEPQRESAEREKLSAQPARAASRHPAH